MRRLVVAFALFAGCARPDDRSIKVAVEQFVAAAERGDADRVVAMLGASTVDRLRARAREASDLAGGGVTLGPTDVLAVGFEPARIRVARVDEGTRRDGEATALVRGTDGTTVPLRLRLEAGRWRIVLEP